jgi:uncharacterized protein with GYD domain
MPKYLYQASYTTEGIKGVMKDSPSGRQKAAAALAKSLGGSLDAFYFCFGADDVVTIIDLPDNAAAAALAATVGATGLVKGRVTPLLTMEEADKALAAKTVYRAPGQ